MSFAIIGAGGLGGPGAYALAAAGAGEILLCDPDRVELSNLHRQVQFATRDEGRLKVEALADELVRRGFPRARIRATATRFTADGADELLGGAGLVLEGSDDPPTKFAVNDWAMRAGVPFVIAGVLRYGGHVFARGTGDAGGCYRCFFEEPPASPEGRSCAEAGVLGPAAGVLGAAAARAAIRLAGGDAEGRLEVWADVTDEVEPREVRYNSRPGCPACESAPGVILEEAF